MTRYLTNQNTASRTLALRAFSPLCRFSLPIVALSLLVQPAFATDASVAFHPDGPEVVMETTTRDFGEVFAGEELVHQFHVRNAGTKPLELKEKSALGMHPSARRDLAAALWRTTNAYSTRTVAAMRAAPS